MRFSIEIIQKTDFLHEHKPRGLKEQTNASQKVED